MTEAERAELWTRLSMPEATADEKLRIRIVLGCAQGESGTVIAQRLHTTVQTVSKWRRRYEAHRFGSLSDAPRPGRPRAVLDEQVQAVLDKARYSLPDGAAYWSVRRVSAATGVSASTVQRILRAFGVKPHSRGAFGFSAAPDFASAATHDYKYDGGTPFMKIVSLVLKFLPRHASEVRASVEAAPGASVAVDSGDGRMIVLLEDGLGYAVSDSILRVHQIPQVMSATLSYEYSDETLKLEET
ncbi:MAG: chaperone NapD [Candidatus Accumulibacter sp.]|nr:chaperone NapD [Accumulibacter sp.]